MGWAETWDAHRCWGRGSGTRETSQCWGVAWTRGISKIPKALTPRTSPFLWGFILPWEWKRDYEVDKINLDNTNCDLSYVWCPQLSACAVIHSSCGSFITHDYFSYCNPHPCLNGGLIPPISSPRCALLSKLVIYCFDKNDPRLHDNFPLWWSAIDWWQWLFMLLRARLGKAHSFCSKLSFPDV